MTQAPEKENSLTKAMKKQYPFRPELLKTNRSATEVHKKKHRFYTFTVDFAVDLHGLPRGFVLIVLKSGVAILLDASRGYFLGRVHMSETYLSARNFDFLLMLCRDVGRCRIFLESHFWVYIGAGFLGK